VRPAGPGRWSATLHDRWNIGVNPNGGYLLAVAVRAMSAAVERPHPVTVTAHYLVPPNVGAVEVATEIVKAGRSFATVAASVAQDGRERVRLLGTFGDLAAQRGPTRITATMPSIAPPEACRSLAELTREAGRPVPEAVHRFDIRLPPDSPWGHVELGEPYQITGWIRFADGTEPDTTSLVAFADAFPPTLIGSIETTWVPTLELTVHVRNRPAPGWLLGTFRTRLLIDGLLEEDGEIWDSEGHPVAQCRQLALILQPRNRP
jgi:acyl-CoA thioesterase